MTSTSPRTPRVSRGLALAALCALALTACGTEGAGNSSAAGAGAGAGTTRVSNPAPTTAPTPAVTPTAPRPDPADDPALTPEQQAAELALMQLALTVAEPCTDAAPPVPPPASDEPVPPSQPGTAEQPPVPAPAPGTSDTQVPVEEPEPSTESPWNFERARQEVELSDVEKCAAPLHGKRITAALDAGTPPTPAAVTKALHKIGYDVPHRLDVPHRKNGAVDFTLDLRFMGGQLCLSAHFDGTRTTLTPYGASPDVHCTDVKRRA
ncbi:hypothetical protein AB0F25_15550 [Streptomyces wedmorensis]|uniref:hypothetical protein n=1 Tax=Streptomyces wedmorensis TaxID=43759 RepID=UPI00341FEA6A